MPASPAAVRNLYPVILSGGSGTRLWPMSRSAHPKQLLPLLSAESLLQETVMRLDGAPACAAPLIIANEQHRFQIAEQLRKSGVIPLALMLEPVARNTAPAVAAAAVWLTSRDPEALMLVMPSDHTVKDREAFLAAIAIGRLAAGQGHLVTFGIEATRPETGYGYIRRGAALSIGGAYAVEAFVEKPDRARAETYLAAGSYTWNSGIFLFPAALYLAELTRRLPDTVAAVREAVRGAGKDPDFVRLDPASFAAAENLSVDYAVMEHTDKAAVVPVSMGWSDVGAWDALWDIADQRDGEDNVTMGDVLALDCQGSYLRSEAPMIAALGLENMIVIATHDAILVAPRHRAQEIGRIVKTLKEAGRDTLTNAAASRF